MPSSVIESILHPPLGVMGSHLDSNGPYGPGDHELTHWLNGASSVAVANTYGVIPILHGAIPITWGYTIGFSPSSGIFDGWFYFNRLCQVVVQHQLVFGTGAWVNTDVVDSHQAAQLILWSEALPGRIGLHVEPDVAIDLFFLIVG